MTLLFGAIAEVSKGGHLIHEEALEVANDLQDFGREDIVSVTGLLEKTVPLLRRP